MTPVLKNVVPEYRHCALNEIEGLIYTAGDEAVNPNLYDSEDVGKGDEAVTHYDVLVNCVLPDGKGECSVNLFFDLEMQRENDAGYPIPKRGVYYCCRLVSRQIEKLGEESYDQLRPVYSVWVIKNGIPRGLQNSIYSAKLCGGFSDPNIDSSKIDEQIDLIHLCLVYLSSDLKIEENQSDLIKYLKSVFRRQVTNPDCNPYSEYSCKIEKEVDEFMSLAESFKKEGEMIGRREGEIEVLLSLKKSNSEIIHYLTVERKNPLSEKEAKAALSEYLTAKGKG